MSPISIGYPKRLPSLNVVGRLNFGNSRHSTRTRRVNIMFYKELLLTLAIASDLLRIPVSGKEMELSDGILHRSTRQVLLWPNSTLLQVSEFF